MFDNIRATSDFPTSSLAPIISRQTRGMGSSIAAPCAGGGREEEAAERASCPARVCRQAATSWPSRDSGSSSCNNKRGAKVIFEQHVLLQVFKANARLEKKNEPPELGSHRSGQID